MNYVVHDFLVHINTNLDVKYMSQVEVMDYSVGRILSHEAACMSLCRGTCHGVVELENWWTEVHSSSYSTDITL